MQFLPSTAASISAESKPADRSTNCPSSTVAVLLAEAPPASARSTCSSSPAEMAVIKVLALAVINGSVGSPELEVLALALTLTLALALAHVLSPTLTTLPTRAV